MNWTKSHTLHPSTQGITGGKGNLKEFLYYLDPVLEGIVSRVPSLHSGKSHLRFQVTAALLSQQSPDCPCPVTAQVLK